jgi:hypothetical protein
MRRGFFHGFDPTVADGNLTMKDMKVMKKRCDGFFAFPIVPTLPSHAGAWGTIKSLCCTAFMCFLSFMVDVVIE